MSLIKTAVRWRHGTLVLFCIIALMGVLALLRLPLELQPSGDLPEISIRTSYPGASPKEVEDLITRPIEEVLEQVQGIQEINSSSRAGNSNISMEFEWGTNIDEKLVDVLTKLQRVGDLPLEAGEPIVEAVSGTSRPIMWLILSPQLGFTSDPDHYRDLVQDFVLPKLRQVEGIGRVFVSGGTEKEVEVLVDPKALSDRNLTLDDVINSLRNNNRDIRGGPLTIGRREYRVRTVSRSQNVKDLEDFVLRRDQSGIVYLKDVATVQIGRKTAETFMLLNDQPITTIGIERRINANVSAISEQVRILIKELERQLNQQGENIQFVITYDESTYINQSINLVQGNLISGAILAALFLLLFLRSMRNVAIIAITIPITMITVFIVLSILGRSLNVISLAGLGFAVGMGIDNAIVVLENIFNHLQMGKSPVKAAIDGAQEVWLPMLASTLTNVLVFIPIVFVQGETGQLFFDLGIALSTSVLFSLFAAITLVPMLAGLFLNGSEVQQLSAETEVIGGNWLQKTIYKSSAIFLFWLSKLERFLLSSVIWSLAKGKIHRRLFILGIPLILILVSFQLLPPADYLPEGNRNLIIWLTEAYPGTSIPESLRLSEPIRDFLRKQPEIENVLVQIRPERRAVLVFLKPELATAKGLNDMVNRMKAVSGDFPGYRLIVPTRVPIFRNSGKELQIKVSGPDLDQVNQISQDITTQLRKLDSVENVRSNYVFGAPELQVIPRRERLAEVGLSEADIGRMVEAALGGVRASDFVEGKRELDVTVKLKEQFVETPEQLKQLAIYSGSQQVQLSDVAEIIDTTGPDVINRVDSERAITLTVNLAREAPLGQLITETQQKILDPLRKTLPPGYSLELSGAADKLTETLTQLGSTFILSLLIIYLLLVALYRSFLYPLVIMTTVPMGLTGALLSLIIANYIPDVVIPLDMITGLGFVILTGVVVNNAILLVDRALQLQQEGMEYNDSLITATRDRLRPIFMTVVTSVLGMLPLAIVPGQGAELYQGLGIVLTGGLVLSTLLTPTVVPALMGLLKDVHPHQPLTKTDVKPNPVVSSKY